MLWSQDGSLYEWGGGHPKKRILNVGKRHMMVISINVPGKPPAGAGLGRLST